MGLEAATFIDDLDPANPVQTDKRKQGDDHLRLLKDVLQATFPRSAKAFSFPGARSVSGNDTVASSDDNLTIVCDTSGGSVTLTLPTLVSGDAGWCIRVLKTTTDSNPVFLVPPSGTINGFTKVRRSVPHFEVKVLWTGTAFVVQRQNSAPIGSVIPFFGTTLPPGHLWPDGTTYSSTNFVELFAVFGTTSKPFMNGRIPVCHDELGGVVADVLSGDFGEFDPDHNTVGAIGGFESHRLTESELASHDHGANVSDPGHDHEINRDLDAGQNFGTNFANQATGSGTETTGSRTTGISVDITDAGDDEHHNNVQPSIVVNYILVAE